jgi:hypothetical protein
VADPNQGITVNSPPRSSIVLVYSHAESSFVGVAEIQKMVTPWPRRGSCRSPCAPQRTRVARNLLIGKGQPSVFWSEAEDKRPARTMG